MPFRHAGYSVEQLQQQLVDRGPGSFRKMVWLQEDISPIAPAATAEPRMAARMRKLAPRTELIITDPYLFTGGRKHDSQRYAASVARMLEPALTQGLRIKALVGATGNNATVRSAVLDNLYARGQNLEIDVVEVEDFHDRFWIADRNRGLIFGASLNKIGSRIFFVDELSDADVKAVLAEVDACLGADSEQVQSSAA